AGGGKGGGGGGGGLGTGPTDGAGSGHTFVMRTSPTGEEGGKEEGDSCYDKCYGLGLGSERNPNPNPNPNPNLTLRGPPSARSFSSAGNSMPLHPSSSGVEGRVGANISSPRFQSNGGFSYGDRMLGTTDRR
ncbi:unnamed protein product, partial [Discosporangium mesarthrocarpum]